MQTAVFTRYIMFIKSRVLSALIKINSVILILSLSLVHTHTHMQARLMSLPCCSLSVLLPNKSFN